MNEKQIQKIIEENGGTANQFQLDGDVVQHDKQTGETVVKVVSKRRGKTYENVLVVQVPDSLADKVVSGTRQSFIGAMVRNEDTPEPALLVMDVQPTEDYFNLGQAIIELGGVEFFASKPDKNKPQFASVFGDSVDGANTISAVAFRGLSTLFQTLAEGSVVVLGGQLRRKAFTDESGRFSTDIICEPTLTEVITRKAKKTFRAIPAALEAKAAASAKSAKKAKKV